MGLSSSFLRSIWLCRSCSSVRCLHARISMVALQSRRGPESVTKSRASRLYRKWRRREATGSYQVHSGASETGDRGCHLSRVLQKVQFATHHHQHCAAFHPSAWWGHFHRWILDVLLPVSASYSRKSKQGSKPEAYKLIHRLAGFSTAFSFQLFVVLQVVSMVGNICSWFVIDRVGRRNLTLWGVAVLTVILMLAGGLATVGSVPALKGCIAFMVVYGFFYNISIGSTAYTILTENATSRLRIKTIAIGIAVQNSWYTMWNLVLPYLFNPDKANLGAKVCFTGIL